jgi:hypothetical protein
MLSSSDNRLPSKNMVSSTAFNEHAFNRAQGASKATPLNGSARLAGSRGVLTLAM